MRVAISTDGEFVSEHFGRCPSFTVVDIEDGIVRSTMALENPGHQPGVIPQFLHQKGVNCIVAGGMGMRARGFFDEVGMQAILGITGRIDDVIRKLQNGILQGGESLCKPGAGKGYGLDKEVCDHPDEAHKKCKH
ncbi:MAG: dinitrogenase iron-molybdenum cofactor [Nitrospira bacterium SM23_35]|nr:MAG: dinitrogenase iron-molybdenum cofactor [Nitrospira bacterium SM23_35]